MKKLLLKSVILAALISMANGAVAQNEFDYMKRVKENSKVQRTAANNLRSYKTQDWNGTAWNTETVNFIDYNAQNRQTINTTKNKDSINQSRIVYTYNAKGLNDTVKNEIWDAANSKWVPVETRILEYTPKDFLTKEIYREYNGTTMQFRTASINTIKFNANDDFTEQSFVNYNEINLPDTVFGFKLDYTYNGEQRITSLAFSNYVRGTGFEKFRKNTYNYVLGNVVDDLISQNYNTTTQMWENTLRVDFTYNNNKISKLEYYDITGPQPVLTENKDEITWKFFDANADITLLNFRSFDNLSLSYGVSSFIYNEINNNVATKVGKFEYLYTSPGDSIKNYIRNTYETSNNGATYVLTDRYTLEELEITGMEYNFDGIIFFANTKQEELNTINNTLETISQSKYAANYIDNKLQNVVLQESFSNSEPLENNTRFVFAETIVGINKNTKINGIAIYPNPANTEINITSNSKSDFNIIISDITGKIVLSFENNTAESVKIPVENLPKGAYFVKITSTDVNFVQKIMIQ